MRVPGKLWAWCLISTAVWSMDPQSYFQLQKALLELKVSEMKAQEACLRQEHCSVSDRIGVAETFAKKRAQLLERFATNGQELVRYYTRHAKELESLYRGEGAQAQTLQRLEEEIRRLDAVLQSLSKERS